jgi:hypothetical protein
MSLRGSIAESSRSQNLPYLTKVRGNNIVLLSRMLVIVSELRILAIFVPAFRTMVSIHLS